MKIIEAQDVDIIEPFPLAEVKRLVGWMHCYKSMIIDDSFPHSPEEVEELFKKVIPTYRSWGVIDKNNKLNSKHEAPLIGFIGFERSGLFNGYSHVASTRKAWGSRLIDQAAERIIEELFASEPNLLRISTICFDNNYPAKGLARRLGFTQDGLMKDMVLQNGVPKAIAHYGLLRSTKCQ